MNHRKELKKLVISKSLAKKIKMIVSSPDFRRLKSVIENNISHKNQNVYNHTLEVVEKVKNLFCYININNCQTLSKSVMYFNAKIGRFSRWELFLLSAYMHDLGKAVTNKIENDGNTSAFGHEKESVNISFDLSKRIDLKKQERQYILDVINSHSGYSLRFLSFLDESPKDELEQGLAHILYIPEILIYMIFDNDMTSKFFKYKRMIMELLQIPTIYTNERNLICAEDKKRDVFNNVTQYIRKNSKPWPLSIRLLHLVEEVGELSDVYLQYLGAKDNHQDIDNIIDGLNDIFIEIIAIYDLLGIDIKTAIKQELKKQNEK